MIVITDNETVLSFSSTDTYGWFVTSYRQSLPGLKTLVEADSPFVDGKHQVFLKLANPIDSLSIRYVGVDQDECAQALQLLTNLLDKARNYWTGKVGQIIRTNATLENRLVWLCVKGTSETNQRYAVIINYTCSELNDQIGPNFIAANNVCVVEVTITLEREIFRHRKIDLTTQQTNPSAETAFKESGDPWTWPQNTFTTKPKYGAPQIILGGTVTANLDWIKTFDASLAAWNTVALGNMNNLLAVPVAFWPTNPAGVGDLFYLGSDSATGNGGMIVPHYFRMSAGLGSTVVAEYWNGAAWATIPAWSQVTHVYSEAGVGSHVLIQYNIGHIAGLARQVAVNGVLAHWIRYRVTGAAAGNPNITQIIPAAFENVLFGEFAGDYKALVKIYLHFIENLVVPTVTPDRFLIGAYSESRIPAYSFQQSSELMCTLQIIAPAPVTQLITYPGDSYGPLVELTYLNLLARTDNIGGAYGYDARGKFRLLLAVKCYRLGGGVDVSNKWGFRLRDSETGGRLMTTATIYNKLYDVVEVIDFGSIVLPVSSDYGQSVPSATSVLDILVDYTGDGAADNKFVIYWVGLIPQDEFYADIYDKDLLSMHNFSTLGIFRDTLIVDSAVIQDKAIIAAYTERIASTNIADQNSLYSIPLLCASAGELTFATQTKVKLQIIGLMYDLTADAWFQVPTTTACISYGYFSRYKTLRGRG